MRAGWGDGDDDHMGRLRLSRHVLHEVHLLAWGEALDAALWS